MRLEAPGAEDLARLVGRGGDHREPLREPRRLRGRRGQLAEPPARRHELRQLLATDGERIPLPVEPPGPAQAPVVERDVADLSARRVDEAPREPVREEAREEEVSLRLLPGLGLVPGEPVRLGLGLEVADRLGHAGEAEERSPRGRRRAGRPRSCRWSSQTIAGRSGRPFPSVQTIVARCVVTARPAIASRPHPWLREERPARLADVPPVELRVLLGETRRPRHVGLDRDAAPREEVPGEVEQERPDALRPVVDREELVAAHAQSADAASAAGAAGSAGAAGAA